MAKTYLSRKESFSASHRLHSQHLSDAENKKLFGKCNGINGHGHNYIVEVTIFAEVDKNGLTMNLFDLEAIMKENILDRFDHKHLNLDTAEFKDLNPTSENLAIVCWNLLSNKLPSGFLFEVKIYETDKNTAAYRGE